LTGFDSFIGIDYSGAKTADARLPGLQVYRAQAGGLCAKLTPPSTRNARATNWTRGEIAGWLRDEARSGRRFIAGLDHCFSAPQSWFVRYGLTSWPAFLDDFALHWPTHRDDVSVEALRDESQQQRTGAANELRLCERWTSSAKSMFLFDVQGSVAKSSHAGIPWLKWLRDEAGDALHFWPFDGWVPGAGQSVIVECYPSLYRRRYPREQRSIDEQDACTVARWMAEMADRGVLHEYFAPPLCAAERRVADLEGWIFGVR